MASNFADGVSGPQREVSSSSLLHQQSMFSLPSPLSSMTRYNGGDMFAGLPPPRAKATAVASTSVIVLLSLWMMFVLNRALHPLIIDLSKGPDGLMHYSKLSPLIAKSFMSVLACNCVALLDPKGWRHGLSLCYGGESLRVFGVIGAYYAVGDYLEMMSMASMTGAAYQVLLQSKLMITALLMWVIKGRSARQSSAQWSVLATLTVGMALFMLVQPKAASKGSKGDSSSGIIGLCFVLGKVLVSCYSAVKADQSLKAFKHLPLYAQLSQLMCTWGVSLLLMAAVFDPAAVSSPSAFFHGWSFATCLVVLSFALKTLLTMTLLKVLDSVQKNIGEAVAMLVIYFGQVCLPAFSQTFEVNTFLAMLIVVLAVITYILLKKESKGSEPKEKDGKQGEARLLPDAKAQPRPPKAEV